MTAARPGAAAARPPHRQAAVSPDARLHHRADSPDGGTRQAAVTADA